MDTCIGGWETGGWMDGWMDGWMCGWIHGCVGGWIESQTSRADY